MAAGCERAQDIKKIKMGLFERSLCGKIKGYEQWPPSVIKKIIDNTPGKINCGKDGHTWQAWSIVIAMARVVCRLK